MIFLDKICETREILDVIRFALKIQNVDFYLIGTIGGLLAILFYIVLYNRMMIYVENNAYKKIEK